MANGKVSAQACPHSKEPGSYHIITRLGNSTLNPGETLKFDQYITGYGNAEGIKIVVYPSSDIFDLTSSTVTKGLMTSPHTGRPAWGAEQAPMSKVGMALNLGDHFSEQWDKPCYFFDHTHDGKSLAICTELDLGDQPPFSYTLKIDKKAAPGNYYIVFVMTYFDGSQWNTKEEKVPFKVNNTFEKYSKSLSILAAIALATSICADGIAPIAEHYFEDELKEFDSSMRATLREAPDNICKFLGYFSYAQ